MKTNKVLIIGGAGFLGKSVINFFKKKKVDFMYADLNPIKNFNQNFIYFLMPHSGRHFLRFQCDLVPKSSILGAPWRPAGPKMAPKIAQVAQKLHPFLKPVAAFLETWNRLASKVAFGTFLGTILVDFGWFWEGFCMIFV